MALLSYVQPVVLRLELDSGWDGQVSSRVASALPLVLVDEPAGAIAEIQ